MSPSLEEYVVGIRGGDPALLGQALTLLESTRREHQEQAQELLTRLGAPQRQALRIGITGAPGVGKSTLIEALGQDLLAQGHKLAVLAIDPSSQSSGGSLLGDKTRMAKLGRDPRAFIRPSPNAGTLGGVARRTRACTRLCPGFGSR